MQSTLSNSKEDGNLRQVPASRNEEFSWEENINNVALKSSPGALVSSACGRTRTMELCPAEGICLSAGQPFRLPPAVQDPTCGWSRLCEPPQIICPEPVCL